MAWFLGLCGVSLAIGAFIDIEKVKKENRELRERIDKLEEKVI